MHRFWRKMACMAALTAFGVALAAGKLMVQAERVPPIGWETRVAPGFDPPIEYYIAYREAGFEYDTAKETVAKWGPKALDVLQRMLDDPAWAAYRDDVSRLIPLVQSPEAVALLVKEAEKQIADPGALKDKPDLHNALARLAGADYAAYVKFMDAHLASAKPEVQRTMIGVLTYQLRGDHAAECEARLKKIVKTSTDDGMQKLVSEAIAENDAHKRANEPMQKVLDAESRKGSQP